MHVIRSKNKLTYIFPISVLSLFCAVELFFIISAAQNDASQSEIQLKPPFGDHFNQPIDATNLGVPFSKGR